MTQPRRTPAKKTAAKKATTAQRSATARKAAQPRDRRPAASEAKGPEAKKVQVAGREWAIQPEAADDFELLEDLAALDKGDPSKMPGVLRKLLGDKQYDDAMSLLRDKATGRVGLDAGITFAWEILEGLNPNSSSSSS
jgi:hypothetical protein